jgi:hypothetical protein
MILILANINKVSVYSDACWMSLGWVLHFIYQCAECHNADIGLLKKAHAQARALG